MVGVYCNANQKCQLGQLVRGGSRTTQYWVVRSTQYQLESQWSSVELPGLQTHTNTDTSNFTIYTLAVILIRRCDVGSYQRSLVEWDVKYNWISLVLRYLLRFPTEVRPIVYRLCRSRVAVWPWKHGCGFFVIFLFGRDFFILKFVKGLTENDNDK